MTVQLHEELGFAAGRVAFLPEPEGSEQSIRQALLNLGRDGLLDLGISSGSLGDQVALVSLLATNSLSAAFSVWAHRMVIEYLASSNTPLAAQLASGDIVGSTAMAPALQAQLGLGDVDLAAVQVEGGYRVSGGVRWASNLHAGESVMVAAAKTEDGGHIVIAQPVDGKTVQIGPAPQLLALQATASGSITVTRAFVPQSSVLSSDLSSFLVRVRPTFLLLQSALAIGLGEAALGELEGELTGAHSVLIELREDLANTHHRLVQTTLAALDGSLTVQQIVQYRLDAALFAQAAVGAEARRAGGRGYLASSATARRIREAAFLPIQSPTESQLRWELRCSA